MVKNKFTVGTFIQGTIDVEEIRHMKFDVFVGNPPFNGKTDVHFKIMQRVGELSADNSYHAFVFPTNIFNRSGDRQRKYTSWLDTTTVIDYSDCSENFPTVADHLSYFVVKKDGLGSFIDRSVPVPIKFSGATRVVGIDFGVCSKVKDDTFSVPVLQGLSKNGDKNFRFTTPEAAKKLQHFFGRPILVINTFGSTVLYDTIAHLEENLQVPWYRQGLEVFVFDDVTEARRARDWLNSDECKAYIAECMKGGWNMATHIKELF
jgi:hypothetical protein